MDWQSSRGSRSNRIQKNPGERNTLTLVITVFVLMIGAVLLGYLISQAILPALVPITPPQPQSSRTTPTTSVMASASSTVASSGSTVSLTESSVVPETPASSASTPSEAPNVVPDISEPPPSEIEVTAEVGDDLPVLPYYRVQVTSLGSYEGTQTYVDKLTAANYVATVVPKGDRISVQAGIFGQREAAQKAADELQSEGYENAWVTDWSVASYPSGKLSALREAQLPAVQGFAEAVRVVLNGGVPATPTASLPEGTSDSERQEWDVALAALRVWINDPESRRPSQMLKIIEQLEAIYAWY